MKDIERLTSWLGWYSGTILLGNPWNITSLRTWACRSLIYFLGINGLMYVFLSTETDHLTYVSPNLLSRNGRDSLETVVSTTLTIIPKLIGMGLRLVFFISARAIPEFFRSVSRNGSLLLPAATWFQSLVIWTNLLLCILTAGIFTVTAASLIPLEAEADTHALDWMDGQSIFGPAYPFLFLTLSALPSDLTFLTTFTFIFMSTLYVRAYFDGFCKEFRREIENLTKQMEPETLASTKGRVQGQGLGQGPPGIYVLMDELKVSWLDEPNLVKQELLAQLDNLFNVFSFYDRINGPLLVGLLSAACIVFVRVMDHVLVHRLSFWDKCHEWANLMSHLQQLYLLQVGYSMQQNISAKKIELGKLLNLSPESKGKDDLALVMRLLSAWDWNMSASGFFLVTRSHIQAILSVMLAYTVILFQLQLG